MKTPKTNRLVYLLIENRVFQTGRLLTINEIIWTSTNCLAFKTKIIVINVFLLNYSRKYISALIRAETKIRINMDTDQRPEL